MPQDFRTEGEHIQKVNIVYKITDGSGKVSTYNPSFNLKLFDNIDNTVNTDTIIAGWAAGKHYTFYITINANKINFTAPLTMVGAYAGMSISNQLKTFFRSGWRYIIIAILVMTGTFLGSALIAQLILSVMGTI